MTIFRENFKKILPIKVIQFYRRVKDFIFWDDYYQRSWGQEGEDLILARFFNYKRNGFYVDVGAHHPKRFSNTNYFYNLGWTGINIDAMPGSMVNFDVSRKKDVNIEKPISNKKQILTYYGFNEPALNSFSKELSNERNGKRDWRILFTKDIETQRLEELLDSNLPLNQRIDFLTVDVEGYDYKVLLSNNFNKYRPKLILVEIYSSCIDDIYNDQISVLLKEKGYKLYAKTVNTTFFIDETQID